MPLANVDIGFAGKKVTRDCADKSDKQHSDDELEAIARTIERLHYTAIVATAAGLAKAREIFRYRRDERGFSGWVRARLGWSRQKAYGYLQIYERFGTQNLSKRLDTLVPSVLFLISAPSTPEAARTEIIERAEAGESVSVAEAKRTISKAKGQQSAPHRVASAPAETTSGRQKRTNSFDALGWWGSASPEERRHFLDGVGLPGILAAMPPDWRPALEGRPSAQQLLDQLDFQLQHIGVDDAQMDLQRIRRRIEERRPTIDAVTEVATKH
jgi:hypothetical protein